METLLQLPYYIAYSTINIPGRSSQHLDLATPFEAESDHAACQVAQKYRKSLADDFARGNRSDVRVRIRTLEIGSWDKESASLTTTTMTHICDTWDDDISSHYIT